jgi:hypothetical protein
MLLKLSAKVIYIMSLLFGWSCFYFDKETNRMKLSKFLYVYNLVMMLLAVTSPKINFNIYLPKMYKLSKPLMMLIILQAYLQSLMVGRFYFKLGRLRKSIMEIVNLAIELHSELRKNFELKFNLKIFKLVLLKFFVVDLLIVALKVIFIVKCNLDSASINPRFIACAVLTVLATYFLNIYNIFHAAIYCILQAFNDELCDISTQIGSHLLTEDLVFKKLLKLEEFFFKIINFSNNFKKLLSEFISLIFANSLLNLLVQLVFGFMIFVLEAKIDENNIFYVIAIVTVAVAEFFHIFVLILCASEVEKMVSFEMF